MKNKTLFVLFLLLSVTSYAQIPSYLPLSGLVAWFPFTGNAIDSTGHGHDGNVHGTASAAGRYGQPNTAFSFNGTSDYIYIPAGTLEYNKSIDITASLTISAWVKNSREISLTNFQRFRLTSLGSNEKNWSNYTSREKRAKKSCAKWKKSLTLKKRACNWKCMLGEFPNPQPLTPLKCSARPP